MAAGPEPGTDPFDRLYKRWAELSLDKHPAPPSRARWDLTVLFLLSSQDPERTRRYENVEVTGAESLGSDAYDLWSKMPPYTPDLSVAVRTLAELRAYEKEQRGSMKRLMAARDMLARYDAIVATQEEYWKGRKAKAAKAQTSIVIIGCAGMAAILMMALTVLLIIALKWNG